MLLATLLVATMVVFGQEDNIIHVVYEPSLSFVVNPQHLADDTIVLDYDQDGIHDHFIFSEHVFSWAECRIRIQGVQGTDWRINPNPSNMGDTISYYDDSLFIWPWLTKLRGWKYDHSIGVSGNVYTDTYYSARKPLDDKYLYAWFRMSITWKADNDVTVEVHEIACCTEPGYPLCVGQTDLTWDVEETGDESDITVSPNPSEGVFTVRSVGLASVEVYNTLGQHVLTTQANGSAATIDLANQPAGLYFINVTDDEGKRCVKKVVRQ